MRIKIQIIIEADAENGAEPLVEEIARVERAEVLPETLGLTLSEAKAITAGIQKVMTTRQITEYLAQNSSCPQCDSAYAHKGRHPLVFRTLFGKLSFNSPRLFSCNCQPAKSKTFSPLAALLPERIAPEFLYLQSKWSALMSYGLTADLLAEVLPLDKPIRTVTLIQSVHKVAERTESELGPEEFSFIEGCPQEWSDLPPPAAPLTVGIDGGYVHAREGKNRKAGWFEVIVGKSIPTPSEGETPAGPQAKCFGFVNDYDKKPKRRLYELLQSQGMQNNQQITFLSDGGDSVRQIQLYLNPEAEYILDWFHITMRLTVLGQYLKGLPQASTPTKPEAEVKSLEVLDEAEKNEEDDDEDEDEDENEEEASQYPEAAELEKELERVKWYLWHGNALKALQVLGDLEMDMEGCELEESRQPSAYRKIFKAVQEFSGYIRSNQSYIVNYGDRHRNAERISSSIAESTVNQLISKRFVKKQQMRWTKKGVHLLLQVRTKVLNGELESIFQRWYPGMKSPAEMKAVGEERIAC